MEITEHFDLAEFNCKDGTVVPEIYLENVKELAKNLEVIRTEIKQPLHINSGYRTVKHNNKVGGKPQSLHLVAKASDLTTKGLSPKQLHKLIEKLIAKGKISQGGLGLYPGFVHYDIGGTKARW